MVLDLRKNSFTDKITVKLSQETPGDIIQAPPSFPSPTTHGPLHYSTSRLNSPGILYANNLPSSPSSTYSNSVKVLPKKQKEKLTLL
jgi:hypothetical protein